MNYMQLLHIGNPLLLLSPRGRYKFCVGCVLTGYHCSTTVQSHLSVAESPWPIQGSCCCSVTYSFMLLLLLLLLLARLHADIQLHAAAAAAAAAGEAAR
jgi:hypothetical protein